MAMTKEEQKAASDRIMAKLGPFTPEEQAIYDRVTKKPETYKGPTREGLRVCGECGAEFEDEVNAKGEVVKPALEQFADHQSRHNPSPAEWTEAHNRIQAGKEKAKGKE